MALVATAGVAFGIHQGVWRLLFTDWYMPLYRDGQTSPREWTPFLVAAYLTDLVVPVIPVAGAWTATLPVLGRLAEGGTSWRRLWRRPGMAACLAAGLGWVWGSFDLALGSSVARLLGDAPAPGSFSSRLQIYLADQVFPYVRASVAAVWATLILTGRWRRSHDAPDLLGRAVGLAWLVVGLVWGLRPYLHRF